MVNVPTAVWINEGPDRSTNEVAYVDNRYKAVHGIGAAPYLDAIRDWVNGDRSTLSWRQQRRAAEAASPDRAMADAEFAMGEYLYKEGKGRMLSRTSEAQRLAPDNWNYKRQAWALSDAGETTGQLS
jgi:hypothetical protein